MLQLAVPLQHSVTAVHQENSPQLSNAKAFKSEMQVKDFKKNNVTIFNPEKSKILKRTMLRYSIQTSQCTVKL
jgi:hypothetical protein